MVQYWAGVGVGGGGSVWRMAAVTGRHWARTLVSASVTPDPGTPEPGHNIPQSTLIHSQSFRTLLL